MLSKKKTVFSIVFALVFCKGSLNVNAAGNNGAECGAVDSFVEVLNNNLFALN